VVKFEWKNIEWKMLAEIDHQIQIKIKGKSGQDQHIYQISNKVGELALGIKLSPTNHTLDEA
jgi:hypothetical protein